MLLKNKNMPIDEYTPCRISACYLDEAGEIEIVSRTGVRMFRLKGLGRIIWLMLDGKTPIREIITQLCLALAIDDRDGIRKELLIILAMLRKRGVIIINWDPIYKLQLNQELD
jgi:hypothetical protein